MAAPGRVSASGTNAIQNEVNDKAARECCARHSNNNEISVVTRFTRIRGSIKYARHSRELGLGRILPAESCLYFHQREHARADGHGEVRANFRLLGTFSIVRSKRRKQKLPRFPASCRNTSNEAEN